MTEKEKFLQDLIDKFIRQLAKDKNFTSLEVSVVGEKPKTVITKEETEKYEKENRK